MTPHQFKQARLSLGLSSAQLGHILNVNERTVRRWEQDDGTRPPSPVACRVIEWMLGGYCRPPQHPNFPNLPLDGPDQWPDET